MLRWELSCRGLAGGGKAPSAEVQAFCLQCLGGSQKL